MGEAKSVICPRSGRAAFQRLCARVACGVIVAASSGSYAQSQPTDALQERVIRSAKFLVEYSSELVAPSFRWVERSASAQNGLYYDLGRVSRAAIKSPGDDVLCEVVLQRAWLLSLRAALSAAFADTAFWKNPVADAEESLNRYIVPANIDRHDQAAVDEIQEAMARERERVAEAVSEYAASRNEKAYANADRSLAAQQYTVVVTTDPAGAEVGYVPVHEAAMQVARTNVRFPEQISYYNLTGSRATLGGSYVFRAKWQGLTKYFPGVRVTGTDEIRLSRGAP